MFTTVKVFKHPTFLCPGSEANASNERHPEDQRLLEEGSLRAGPRAHHQQDRGTQPISFQTK